MSSYFAIGTNNYVVGFDPTIESLKLASDFVEKNNIDNIEFINADIFDDVLKKDFFDFIFFKLFKFLSKHIQFAPASRNFKTISVPMLPPAPVINIFFPDKSIFTLIYKFFF